MKKEQVKTIYDGKYLKLYDLQYEPGAHYYNASRREKDRLPALMTDAEHKAMLPDAVSCFVVLNVKGEPKRLLLNKEYRYPAGRYLLSVPAGLIDKADYDKPDAIELTAARELYEETGILVETSDEIRIINRSVYSTPGMTDECNALVLILLNRDSMPEMNHKGAEGSEHFDGFSILTKEDAERILVNGQDDEGISYPLYTWACLMFFLGMA
ncbi:MAG: NUDIX hydrolase [Eubacterium sp.]|nr:NUDIX hydrolase [Eubacterium sp.]